MALERPYVPKQVVGADFIQFRAAKGFKTNHTTVSEPFLKKGFFSELGNLFLVSFKIILQVLLEIVEVDFLKCGSNKLFQFLLNFANLVRFFSTLLTASMAEKKTVQAIVFARALFGQAAWWLKLKRQSWLECSWP